MKRLLLIVALVLMCSCSAKMYNTDNHNVTQTQVMLNKANFKIVGTVTGSDRATYVFGIGGLSRKALQGNAVADMYKNANLTGSQAIINVNLRQSVSAILCIGTIEYVASGTVVEFCDVE